ncbi:epimerase [Paenibacillus sp. IHBB 3054]|uniref:epimerase n=1 Tax=Paenibacillus sp. IHBB 3054 TaxID=3425689 RepID=UPI003F66D9E8
MTESDMLNKFGKMLISQVRDETIEQWERILSGQVKSKRALKIYSEIQLEFDEQAKTLVTNLLTQAVDSTLHNFLYMCEQEDNIDIIFKDDEDGGNVEEINIKEVSDGLSGELYTEDGWILSYSTKPYVEP